MITSKHKKRAPFVTLWLWMGIVMSLISIPITLIQYQNLTSVNASGDTGCYVALDAFFLQVASVICGIIVVYGFISLLRWNRIGFYILCVVPLLSILQAYVLYLAEQQFNNLGLSVFPIHTIIFTAIIPIIFLVALRFVLNMKRDEKSCWELLN